LAAIVVGDLYESASVILVEGLRKSADSFFTTVVIYKVYLTVNVFYNPKQCFSIIAWIFHILIKNGKTPGTIYCFTLSKKYTMKNDYKNVP